jgi:hypothetical protein
VVLLLVLSKDDCKISVSFDHIQNFQVSNLVMAKVEKFNIAVTYLKEMNNEKTHF